MLQRLFAKLDLYKAIIVICLLAMPVIGYFIWSLQEKIDIGKRALARATMTNPGSTQTGDIEAIGMLLAQINKLKVSKAIEGSSADSHRVTFQTQIRYGVPGLKVDDYVISEKKTSPVMVDKGRQATNEAVTIDFRRDGQQFPLPREAIFNMLFNIESQTAWKLSKLKMKNKEMFTSAAQKAPPPELPDEWRVETMEFSHKVPKEAK